VPRRNPRPGLETRHPGARSVFAPLPVWWFAIAIVAAGAWAYANSFDGPFVFDDVPGILENPSIHSLWPPSQWFAAPPGSTPSGRPVLNLSLALNYAFGGYDVWGYHAVNLALHLASALVLFGVVRRTLLSERMRERCGSMATIAAFASALMWVVHPLTTESVTYVIQRGEALAALCLLLTLYLPPAGAVAACAIGMGSKETMIVAPILVILWDHVFRPGGARRWRFYLALFATTIVVFAPMLSETQGRTAVARAVAGGGPWTPRTYLLTQTGAIAHYLEQAFLPRPLVFDYYGWPRAISVADVWPQALFIATLAALSIWGVIRRSPAGFAGAAFFLLLAPTSSLLPIPTEIVAEHRMYLPLAAVIAFVGMLTLPIFRQPVRRVGATLFVVYLVYQAAAMTRERNLDYRSDMALWEDTVRRRPDNARARLNYAIDLMRAGRAAEAEAQMRNALTLDMDAGTRAQALLQLGAALSAQGQLDAGIQAIEQGLQIDPALPDADGILGQAYADQGKDALAVTHLLRAIEDKGRQHREITLQRTAWLLATSRDPAVRDGARAAALAEEAIALTGGNQAVFFETLAAARAEQGRVADAVAAMDRALALTRAKGDAQTTSLYERQRAFYAAGGRVAK